MNNFKRLIENTLMEQDKNLDILKIDIKKEVENGTKKLSDLVKLFKDHPNAPPTIGLLKTIIKKYYKG